MALPLSIGRHLRALLIAQAHPCLLHLDHEYLIVEITGDAERYGIAHDAVGVDVRDLLPLMHGSDLTSEERWPMVEVTDGVHADVVIKPIARGAHLLLIDVSHEHAERQAVQQHANEVHLLNSKLRQSLEALEAARVELEQRNRELDELNRIKTRFIAGLSHELRTPLTAVIGHSELLRERCTEEHSDFEESLRAIESGSGYLMSLVNNVLDQASLETGQLAMHPAPTDLALLLDETAAMLRPMAERRGLAFRFEPSRSIPDWVETDATRLRQVVINLANNAIKYTDHGFVELSADWSDGRFRVAVADSGPGIPPEQRERIMLPFQRGERTGKQSGVGLGLAISLQIIKLLGGELTIGERPGGGSVFAVELPLTEIRHEPAPAAAGEAQEPRVGQGVAAVPSRLPVLLVEDSPGIRILYRHVIKAMGHPVDEAVDADSVRQHFKLAQPAIMIIDLNLGDSDGADLVQALRNEGYDGLIVGWSASSLREDQERMLAAGADAYLVKPVPPPVLKETLRELLQARAKQRAS
jgi:signal transduction histidine kinase/CheY-like chemotaxis protein